MVALLLASSQIVTSQLAFLSKLDLPLPGLSLSPLPTERDSDQRTAYLRKKKKEEKKKEKRAFFLSTRFIPFWNFIFPSYIVLLSFSPFLFFSFPFLLRLEDTFLRALFLPYDKSIKKRVDKTREFLVRGEAKFLLLFLSLLFLLKEKTKNELEGKESNEFDRFFSFSSADKGRKQGGGEKIKYTKRVYIKKFFTLVKKILGRRSRMGWK